jgi:hypothetical protein
VVPADPAGIRPSRGYAYCIPDAYFDREYLFVVSEIDPVIHRLIEQGQMTQIDNTTRHATAWFENGRAFPDTMVAAFDPSLPNQPYDANPMMHPGERVLMRLVGGGRDLHPFHTHGQNHLVIARDGSLLKTAASAIIDLPVSDFTTPMTALLVPTRWRVHPHIPSIRIHTNIVPTTESPFLLQYPLTASCSLDRCMAGLHTSGLPVNFHRHTCRRIQWEGYPSCGIPTMRES